MSAFFYRIGLDGYVYPGNERIPIKTLYFIETALIPEKTTPNGWQYYTSFVQNNDRQRVADNVLDWNGIRCRIEERDGWASDTEKSEFGVDGIVLRAFISDSKGIEKKFLFENNSHDGQAWMLLMAYIRDLFLAKNHKTVALMRNLRLK
ncbi:hypothetical protein [Hymenobacter rubripertinctus]|uniref:hypothetical protein n=1 Tax=Hymenobacter rubripertinctus TaxID=2029981 RepID=UPI0011C3CF89|nr:hypothetical protein [Hymenobacter rubripertinctus]